MSQDRAASSTAPNSQSPSHIARSVLLLGIFPFFFYLVSFILLTDRLITRLSTRIWSVSQDGYMYLWNLWWVNHALTESHQSPFYTPLVEYPLGAWLWIHSLAFFNGLLAIPLLRFFDLVTVHNALALFGFVASGVTAFWLAYYLTRALLPSLVAGFLFTFSHYHFAHLLSHLDLISLEWLPIFVLAWYASLKTANWKWGAAAGLSLLPVFWSHAYYFFYCVITGFIMYGWFALRHHNFFFIFRQPYRSTLFVFVGTALLTSGPFVAAALWQPIQEPFVGHNPEQNSLDLLALVVPARIWRFQAYLEPYWTNWNGNLSETNAALPLAALALAVGVWLKRASIREHDLGLWYILLLVFGVLSLGPVLHLNGAPIDSFPLPYPLLEIILPPVRGMGVPARMIVVSLLALSVITAYGLRSLWRGSLWLKGLAVLITALIIIHSLPTPIPTLPTAVPTYVHALKALPAGAVYDRVGLATPPGIPPGQLMYYQTVHQKPIAFGSLSRVSSAVTRQNARIAELFALGDYLALCSEMQFRYLVVAPGEIDSTVGLVSLYQDRQAEIYDLTVQDSLPTPIICKGS